MQEILCKSAVVEVAELASAVTVQNTERGSIPCDPAALTVEFLNGGPDALMVDRLWALREGGPKCYDHKHFANPPKPALTSGLNVIH